MSRFQIHHQLLLDCHRLGRFELCHLLLHKNASVSWFILVPEIDGAGDLLDLPDKVINLTMAEAKRMARFIKTGLGYQTINFATIGNVVPQLHLHIIGRRQDDPCWPAPVWGNLLETREYSTASIGTVKDILVRDYSLEVV